MPERDTRAILMARKEHLVAYLLSKFEAEDWHAVQDAASDIREIEAQLELLEHVTKGVKVISAQGLVK